MYDYPTHPTGEHGVPRRIMEKEMIRAGRQQCFEDTFEAAYVLEKDG